MLPERAPGPRGGIPGIPDISDEEFALFQSLIRREAGILLTPTKKPMLVGRLCRRLNSLGLTSFSEYYRHVVYTGEREMVRLLDAICTNETWFFRNPDHFTFIREQLVPGWGADVRASRRQPRLRVWSAACSSGEEPYSLAMVLLEALPGWEVNILATDLSSKVLARARAATWPIEKSQDIPPRYLSQYMLRGTRSQQGKMRAGDELRKAVVFDRLNLNHDIWPIHQVGPFDLLFCRNVLMYLDPAARERVIGRLVDRLSPRGHLFLGEAEGTGGAERLRLVAPSVYRQR